MHSLIIAYWFWITSYYISVLHDTGINSLSSYGVSFSLKADHFQHQTNDYSILAKILRYHLSADLHILPN